MSSSSPEFPYPGGTPGAAPPDPVAGKPGHFAWSRWVKQFLLNLDAKSQNLEVRIANLEGETPGRND